MLLRTPPHSCSPAWGSREVAELLASSSTSSCDHTPLHAPFIFLALNAGELLRQQNSSCSLPFGAIQTPLYLRQGLNNRLHPMVQALNVPSPGYARSFSTPAESAAVSTSLWPALISTLPQLLSSSSGSRWAPDTSKPSLLCSIGS